MTEEFFYMFVIGFCLFVGAIACVLVWTVVKMSNNSCYGLIERRRVPDQPQDAKPILDPQPRIPELDSSKLYP